MAPPHAGQPPADEAGEELAAALEDLGIAPEAVERAIVEGRPGDAIFDSVLDPSRAGRTVSVRAVEEAGGPRAAEQAEMMLAFGLSRPETDDEPFFTEEEARALVELERNREVWPPSTYLQVARVYGQALARIARTEIALFRLTVEPGLRRSAADDWEALNRVRAAFERLLPIGDVILNGIHHRWVEHEFAAVAAIEAERRVEDALPGALRMTILFVDLKDFTAYAELRGDAAAAHAVAEFADVVYRSRGESGEIVKALGDGYMLAYPDPAAAAEATLRIAASARDRELPPVHASAHAGAVILRDGDYFGSAVNTAARLLALAGGDELLATRATASAAGSGFEWEPRGEQAIRGLRDPVEVLSLSLEPR